MGELGQTWLDLVFLFLSLPVPGSRAQPHLLLLWLYQHFWVVLVSPSFSSSSFLPWLFTISIAFFYWRLLQSSMVPGVRARWHFPLFLSPPLLHLWYSLGLAAYCSSTRAIRLFSMSFIFWKFSAWFCDADLSETRDLYISEKRCLASGHVLGHPSVLPYDISKP